MRKIIKYINGSWPLVFLAPLLMVLEVMCDLMQPTLMSEIVDVGIASGEISLVWSTGLKMLGVARNCLSSLWWPCRCWRSQ